MAKSMQLDSLATSSAAGACGTVRKIIGVVAILPSHLAACAEKYENLMAQWGRSLETHWSEGASAGATDVGAPHASATFALQLQSGN